MDRDKLNSWLIELTCQDIICNSCIDKDIANTGMKTQYCVICTRNKIIALFEEGKADLPRPENPHKDKLNTPRPSGEDDWWWGFDAGFDQGQQSMINMGWRPVPSEISVVKKMMNSQSTVSGICYEDMCVFAHELEAWMEENNGSSRY